MLSITDVDKGGKKFCLVILSFPLLDNHDVLDSLHDVKPLKICSEFALLDLRKVEHILDHELETE